MTALTRWLRKIRLNALRRRLAVVEARIEQERQYLPTIYPMVMESLVTMRAKLLFDIKRLTD